MKGRAIPKIQYQCIQNQSLRILILLILALFCPSLKEAVATEAPIQPRNKRVIIVAQSGTRDYSSIQAALSNARPGDTIQVKDGTYNGRVVFNISGTKSEPITLMNYPGHKPVIRPGGSKSLGSVSSSENIIVNTSWTIIDGFRITNGWNGFFIKKPHVTIRNNLIHDNSQSGILAISGNLLIQDNIVKWNGVKTCKNNGTFSPKHCHGMYMSSNGSQNVSDISIKGNTVSYHSGNGIMFLTTSTGSGHKYHLVQNNLIENNALGGISFNYKVYSSKILNNSIIVKSTPPSDADYNYLIKMRSSTANTFKNNYLNTTVSSVRALGAITSDCYRNTVDYNSWSVAGSRWIWQGSGRSDFKTKYQPVSGWDKNGDCC